MERESIGLCPHGTLPGLCKECLKTDEGQERHLGIENKAAEIGSEIARRLESETGIKPYDVLMVLGAGFEEEPPAVKERRESGEPIDEDKTGWHLNKEFRMRLNAAAQLYVEGRARVICLTGGPGITDKWKNLPSLAEVAERYLIKKFNIPEKDIIMENQSDATHGNLAYALREMYKMDLPVGSIAILSTNYHLNRAREMAERSGIKADFLPAESQLLKRSPHYLKFVAAWLEHAQNHGLEANEIVKLKDPKYWEDRAAIFETPLNEPTPHIDISQSVADTAKRLADAGAGDTQTSSF